MRKFKVSNIEGNFGEHEISKLFIQISRKKFRNYKKKFRNYKIPKFTKYESFEIFIFRKKFYVIAKFRFFRENFEVKKTK